jgi:hypothetical protein
MRNEGPDIDPTTGKPRSEFIQAASADMALAAGRDQVPWTKKGEPGRGDAQKVPPFPARAAGLPKETDWFKIAAWTNGLVALACLLTGLAQLHVHTEAGLFVIAMALYFGFASVITLIGLSKGIKLALAMKAELAEIRERLPKL